MSAPAELLEQIKLALGITDNADDAWLQQRINGIWARMEVYTSRKLCAPPQKFVDDWGNIASNSSQPLPPILMYPPRGSVFLRYFPVATIEAIELDGGALAPADIAPRWDKATGKLFALRAVDGFPVDLGQTLRQSRARITYTAGWTAIPADLFEVVLGAMQPLWTAKKGGGVPGVSGNVTGINVQDVGSIELSEGNLFVTSAAKSSGGGGDPLLGPWANMLALYIDHRSRIGNEGQPTTEEVPAAAAAAPAPEPVP